MGVSLRLGRFNSPMWFSFKHASAQISETQNIIVALHDGEGCVGYGEGCPRKYVTGETAASAFEFLQKYGGAAAEAAKSLEELQNWSETHRDLIDDNTSAFCALELAVIDLLGKRQNVAVEALLGYPSPKSPAKYTAVMGDSSPLKMLAMSLAYRAYGFEDFKVKLGGDLQRENRRLATLPKSATVRFDANNLWDDADSCVSYCRQLQRDYWAIEEPVNAFDAEAMSNIAQALDTRIILDESCICENHMAPYVKNAKQFVANIRVSKCGGILRSIRLANYCLAHGIDVILGAHVGETSLLTRAGLAVSQGMHKPPLAREGAYGRLLLKQDICEHSIRFGRGGILHPERYDFGHNSGLGVTVKPDCIEWLV
ncbi:MAG: hypothetical protein GKR97_19400 [Rhizobiaceae bacterium]|nr:hypothetical protein [Rhizobiaceae bacterium]